MGDRLEKITYQEDPDMLRWIDGVAAGVAAHRGPGAKVSRADVIRWLGRRARRQVQNLRIEAIASEI